MYRYRPSVPHPGIRSTAGERGLIGQAEEREAPGPGSGDYVRGTVEVFPTPHTSSPPRSRMVCTYLLSPTSALHRASNSAELVLDAGCVDAPPSAWKRAGQGRTGQGMTTMTCHDCRSHGSKNTSLITDTAPTMLQLACLPGCWLLTTGCALRTLQSAARDDMTEQATTTNARRAGNETPPLHLSLWLLSSVS